MDDSKNYLLPAGTQLASKYRIERLLGEGGFGITYEGTDLNGWRVAIKEYYPYDYVARDSKLSFNVIPKPDDKSRRIFSNNKNRFMDEAQVLAQCASIASVVNIFECFEENQTAYIVMEYLDGTPLNRYSEKHNLLDATRLCTMMLPLIRDLDRIHQLGFLHRDISPDNIMLVNDATLRLMDFGAAREFDLENQRSMTVMLKHGFAPYEQYTRHGDQGPWTDIYALCATIYACITGIIPDAATDRLVEDRLKSPSATGAVVNNKIEQVLMKGLSVSYEDRYQNAAQLLQELEAALAIEGSLLSSGPPVLSKKSVDAEKRINGQNTKLKQQKDRLRRNENQPEVARETPQEVQPAAKEGKTKRRLRLFVWITLIVFFLACMGVRLVYTRRKAAFEGQNTELRLANSSQSSQSMEATTGTMIIPTEAFFSEVGTASSEEPNFETTSPAMETSAPEKPTETIAPKATAVPPMAPTLEMPTDTPAPEATMVPTMSPVPEATDDSIKASIPDSTSAAFPFPPDSPSPTVGIVSTKAPARSTDSVSMQKTQYEANTLYPFREGRALISSGAKWGYIDEYGNLIGDGMVWEEARSFHEGLAAVSKNGRWGFIDLEGEIAIKISYEDAGDFNEGLAAVCDNGYYGYINSSGTMEIPPQFDLVGQFREGLAPVCRDGYWGYVNHVGDMALPYNWIDAYEFNQNRAAVSREDGLWGYIDCTGVFVIDAVYDECADFSQGRACVARETIPGISWQLGFVDTEGREVSEVKWLDAGIFSEGMAAVQQTRKMGYIDADGSVVIGMEWDEAQPFYQGMAVVTNNGKSGFINTAGEIVVPLEWDALTGFNDGFALGLLDDNTVWLLSLMP